MLTRIKMHIREPRQAASRYLLELIERNADKDPVLAAWLKDWAEGDGSTVVLRDILCASLTYEERLDVEEVYRETAKSQYCQFANAWTGLDTARAKCNPNYPKD